MREDCQVTSWENVYGQEQADNKESFQVASVHVPADGEEPTIVSSLFNASML